VTIARHLCLALCVLGSQALAQDRPAEKPAARPATEDRFEIRDPQRMMKWALLQQSDVLHELALAYYDRHAGGYALIAGLWEGNPRR